MMARRDDLLDIRRSARRSVGWGARRSVVRWSARRSGSVAAYAAVALLGACAEPDPPLMAPAPAAAGGTPTAAALAPVEASELRVTSGEVVPNGPGRFTIRSPTLRAELGQTTRAAAELAFVYRGPTEQDVPLASGELRRQIGLKLRAKDTCNVVYAMWHLEPKPALIVSVKSNPGQSRHAECGDRGYTFLEPRTSKPAPRIEPGQRHVLGAEVREDTLIVTIDGERSWEGTLPAAALEFDGPVGVRSDNGEFSVELRAEKPGG